MTDDLNHDIGIDAAPNPDVVAGLERLAITLSDHIDEHVDTDAAWRRFALSDPGETTDDDILPRVEQPRPTSVAPLPGSRARSFGPTAGRPLLSLAAAAAVVVIAAGIVALWRGSEDPSRVIVGPAASDVGSPEHGDPTEVSNEAEPVDSMIRVHDVDLGDSVAVATSIAELGLPGANVPATLSNVDFTQSVVVVIPVSGNTSCADEASGMLDPRRGLGTAAVPHLVITIEVQGACDGGGTHDGAWLAVLPRRSIGTQFLLTVAHGADDKNGAAPQTTWVYTNAAPVRGASNG